MSERSDSNKIMCYCRRCIGWTFHDVLREYTDEVKSGWMDQRTEWQIVQCRGCGTICFSRFHQDFRNLIKQPDGSTEHLQKVEYFPSSFTNHRAIAYRRFLPDLIGKIYDQTLVALAGGAYVLAGVGLRACIEAVCNHLEVSGGNLEKRIDNLLKAGHVSKGDRGRLQGIRFLGNDAAHELREATVGELRIALEIVEHLLNTVFLLPKRTRFALDTPVESFDEFLSMLRTCIVNVHPSNTVPVDLELSLPAILKKKVRLVGDSLQAYEQQLINMVAAGQIQHMTLGQIQSVDGKNVQLYVVSADAADDIPF